MSDKLYEFEEVENIPKFKRNRTGMYENLLKEFIATGKPTVKLNWKSDKTQLDTIAVSLRKAVKANPSFNVLVMSRSKINPVSKKRVVYEIYLSKTKETEHKKKGK